MLQSEKASAEVEKRVSRVLNFILNKSKIQKGSKKELLDLVNDLHEHCQMLYSAVENRKDVSAGESCCRIGKPPSVSPASSSDIEYSSAEEIGNSAGELNSGVEISGSGVSDPKHKLEALRSDYARAMKNLQEAEVKSQIMRKEMNDKEKAVSAWRKQLEHQMSDVKAELQAQYDVNGDLKEQILNQANKAKEMEERNKWLCSQNSEVERMLKEKDDEVSNLMKKIGDSEKQFTTRIEDLNIQVRNLQDDVDSVRAHNRDLAGNMDGKRNEELDQLKSLMDQVNATQHELTSLHKQKKLLQSQVNTLTDEALQSEIQIKRLEEELARYENNERMILQEKEEFQTKAENLEQEVLSLHKENQSLVQMGDQSTETSIDFDCQKTIKEHEDIIQRLTDENKDQQKLLKEQKDTIDKLNEDQKIIKRWSFGSTKDIKINQNLLERKMEELAQDFRMKMEDHLRILYRRILVAEQIHIENKESWDKTQGEETRENRASFKTIFKKMKNTFEPGLAKLDEAVKKLDETDNFLNRASNVTNEIQCARTWVSDKNNEVRELNQKIKTISAQLECSKAQESLSKEKLSELEAKLTEEGTEKLNLIEVLAKLETEVKELDHDVKAKAVELLSLGEEKKEAIRQLCILMDHQRTQYVDLKRSVSKITLKP